MKELDTLCSILFAITFGCQLLAALIYLVEHKSAYINARLPGWTFGVVLMTGAMVGMFWIVVALEVDAFPIPWIERFQLAVANRIDPGSTELCMWGAAMILVPFIGWLHVHRAEKPPNQV